MARERKKFNVTMTVDRVDMDQLFSMFSGDDGLSRYVFKRLKVAVYNQKNEVY